MKYLIHFLLNNIHVVCPYILLVCLKIKCSFLHNEHECEKANGEESQKVLWIENTSFKAFKNLVPTFCVRWKCLAKKCSLAFQDAVVGDLFFLPSLIHYLGHTEHHWHARGSRTKPRPAGVPRNATSTGIVQFAHSMDEDLCTKWPLGSLALK